MPVRSRQAEAREADVAIRPMLSHETAAILRAIFNATDYGMLLTDLEHRSLACNRRFGEIFVIDPSEAVRCGVAELRKRVRPLIANLTEWERNLEELYADPLSTFEDDLALLKKPPVTVRRYSGPVTDDKG